MAAIQSGFQKRFDFPCRSEDLSRTRSYSTGTRVFWFRFWIIPEPSAPIPLDKGYGGSGNEITATNQSIHPSIHSPTDPPIHLSTIYSPSINLSIHQSSTFDNQPMINHLPEGFPFFFFPRFKYLQYRKLSNGKSFSR